MEGPANTVADRQVDEQEGGGSQMLLLDLAQVDSE
jgi:hypothetical protein